MIEAFHSNWTTPFFAFNQNHEYFIDDFEILTTILSALKWRQHNGSIKMVTDKIGARYYKEMGLEEIWDLGIDDTLGDCIDDNIDIYLFWAAGKIYALKNQNIPCVMMDTDFIVWESLQYRLENLKLCTIHSEPISDDIYPYKDKFHMKKHYEFDPQWNWSELPCNTAFTYIADENFKNYYTQESIKFMKNTISGDRIKNMVFAEQRMISMCAKKMNIAMNTLTDLKTLAENKQTSFTHTWGYKDAMRHDFNKRNEFCLKCVKRILTDFPEYKNIIKEIPSLKIYYKSLSK